MTTPAPSLEEVKARLHYKAGALFWRRNGEVAGHKDPRGRIRIGLSGRYYYTYHLIYFLHTGQWTTRIDHKDGDCTNNKITNLRPATQRQNLQNRKAVRGKKYKGVKFDKRNGRYYPYICANGVQRWLGGYSTEKEAAAAYDAAAIEQYGAFARLNLS